MTFDALQVRPAKKSDASKRADDTILNLSMLTLRFSNVEAQIEFTDYLRKEVHQQSKIICPIFLMISIVT